MSVIQYTVMSKLCEGALSSYLSNSLLGNVIFVDTMNVLNSWLGNL